MLVNSRVRQIWDNTNGQQPSACTRGFPLFEVKLTRTVNSMSHLWDVINTTIDDDPKMALLPDVQVHSELAMRDDRSRYARNFQIHLPTGVRHLTNDDGMWGWISDVRNASKEWLPVCKIIAILGGGFITIYGDTSDGTPPPS